MPGNAARKSACGTRGERADFPLPEAGASEEIVQQEDQSVRWTLRVSKETDSTLRAFLGSDDRKPGCRAKFVEAAVSAHVFDQMLADIRLRNAETDPDELQGLIDAAVRDVRAKRFAKRNTRKK